MMCVWYYTKGTLPGCKYLYILPIFNYFKLNSSPGYLITYIKETLEIRENKGPDFFNKYKKI